MLRITLRQFRCWDNITIEAPVDQITLICGMSGNGKSTLLQGITYCLYGNMRMVTPNNMDHADTRVTIEFPYILDTVPGVMFIERQRGKGRFVITHN
jgi:DNA repair exonuclease SbcCD ATPase subunit